MYLTDLQQKVITTFDQTNEDFEKCGILSVEFLNFEI